MADIPVEPTRPMPVWAGLLGLLAIAMLVWVLFQIGAGVDTDDVQLTAPTQAAASLPAGRLAVFG